MESLHYILIGISTAMQPENLFFCFIGVFLGTAVGVLPGVGPLATIAMLLPITFQISPEASLIMLAGIFYGAQYGGSTTAILVNMPGEASSAVTAIDGHEMAKAGRAGAALTISALGSFVGGTIAIGLVALFSVPLAGMALAFGPVEYFSLILLGLIASIVLATGSLMKAVVMILLGILLGCTGTDIYFGSARFTFGYYELWDGISIIALAAGIYGLAEILRGLEDESTRSMLTVQKLNLLPTRDDVRRSVNPVLRGTLIGSILGVLPGGGAVLSSFASYAMEKRLAKGPSRFGKGAIEGVAGPETANNAGAQTSFIPMLTLGIPSNPVMALMIGALIIQGIQPGPELISNQPKLFWGLIVSMWIGNVMLVVLNLPLIRLWVKMASIPHRMLFPAIVMFASVGVYSAGLSSFDIVLMVFFGIAGYALSKFSYEPTPLLLGFVLGPSMEEHFRKAMILSDGNMLVFLQKPISAVLLLGAAILLSIMLLPSMANKRAQIFIED